MIFSFGLRNRLIPDRQNTRAGHSRGIPRRAFSASGVLAKKRNQATKAPVQLDPSPAVQQ